ncbi:MAG: tRNA (N6-isopentenyl adenosine(37)-C2)-methylthiotransferase MiaB [Rhodospirillaceae bacterium]|nr:tRNA (N6-isopentenyl adenosine(37)-C2)-methylthiotransferase MiaB [Rhodospirillaceae bacterium]
MRKKFYVKTYGCQMNVYDSARMADILTANGYAAAETPEDVDLVILNTCHIREKAAEKLYSELGRLNRFKQARRRKGKNMVFAVGGCVGQAEGKELLCRAPFVDLVMGPQNYHRLPQLLCRAETEAVVEIEFPAESKFDHLPESSSNDTSETGVSAFLTIQEGCDRFCTFCVVPYTRGAEYSRAVGDIEGEARRLICQGAREITLLGQNVNAYHGSDGDKELSLANLIHRLAEIEGLERLRYTTSHPRDLSEDLIAAHGDVAKLMPSLHLPVQSGSDRILKAMNRQHTAKDYCRLVNELRAARPDIALSSDFIVGFPGESDSEFEETLALAEKIDYAQAYSFKYSPRPGTPAAETDYQVPEDIKSARLAALQSVLARSQSDFNATMIGRTLPVLFEKPGRHANQMLGRSPYGQWVHTDLSADVRGRIADVFITRAHTNSLAGQSAIDPNALTPLNVSQAAVMVKGQSA